MTALEPQVRYCMTRDGVQIAYAVEGAGPGTPVLCLAAPFTNVRESHRSDPHLPGVVHVSRASRPTAWFDFRGCGLSDRGAADVSMETLQRDLEAVIERLAWPQFSIVAMGMPGPLAIKYAAEHPDRVTSLVLRETYARAADMGRIPRMRALGVLLREDWESYLTLMVATAYGWSDNGPRLMRLIADCATPEVVRAYAAATPSFDASMFVEKIQARTLVIGRDDMPVPSGDMLRQLGARIRDARVVMVSGGLDVGRAVALVIEPFLAEGDSPTRAPDAPQAQGMAVVLFIDIVDSTALTEQLGDAAFRRLASTLDAAMRGAIRETGGAVVEGKVLGDGVMGVFVSASSAIDAARRCIDASASAELKLHVGLHAGDVIHEDGNVYGGAVNIASRICALATPGEILVSATVRDLARTSANVAFDDRGERELRGIGDPIRVYAVRGQGAGP